MAALGEAGQAGEAEQLPPSRGRAASDPIRSPSRKHSRAAIATSLRRRPMRPSRVRWAAMLPTSRPAGAIVQSSRSIQWTQLPSATSWRGWQSRCDGTGVPTGCRRGQRHAAQEGVDERSRRRGRPSPEGVGLVVERPARGPARRRSRAAGAGRRPARRAGSDELVVGQLVEHRSLAEAEHADVPARVVPEGRGHEIAQSRALQCARIGGGFPALAGR